MNIESTPCFRGSVLCHRGGRPSLLSVVRGRLDFAAALRGELALHGLDLLLIALMAFDLFRRLAGRFHDLGGRIFDVLPLFALLPRATSFVPGTARIVSGRHVVIGVGEAQVALQNAWREVGL